MEYFIIVVCYFDENISTFYLDTPPGWLGVGLLVWINTHHSTQGIIHTQRLKIFAKFDIYIYTQNMEHKRS